MCNALAQIGLKCGNHHGGTRPYVSYANCGLPYYVGGEIQHESSLLAADERVFREQFAIDVHIRCEAISISLENRIVDLLILIHIHSERSQND